MAAIDKVRALPTISVAATAQDGVRQKTQAENNKRTERFNLRVTGQIDITAAGTGIVNKGSILACVQQLGFTDGGQDKVLLDGRLARFIAECMSESALPSTRLANANIQAATQLAETVPIFLSSPRSVTPNDTKYVEPNKQQELSVFINPLRQITRVAEGGALVGTVTNLAATVEQVFDDMTAAPFASAFTRQIEQNVVGSNGQFKIDLRGSRYLRGIAIQQDTDQGEQSGIISSLVLRGDGKSIIGDGQVPFTDLQEAMQYDMGGAVVDSGYLFIDFQRYGRISSWWNPYQDTNLRLELTVAPLGGAFTGDKVRVALLEYERTSVTAKQIPFTI